MASPEPPEHAAELLADRYELRHKLGSGSMGEVWSGHDAKLRRPVAVKIMKNRAVEQQGALERFEREAMSIARLRSPYLVQVYDYGIDGDVPFIVMELLEGQDLQVRLKGEAGPLGDHETLRIIVQVAKALHAAHEAGIVHRDLKPANIFLVQEHGEEITKVFDFGVAKALRGANVSTEVTAEGTLLGTPSYMSPEQVHGAKRVDHRADLWSLGVIAYQCMTGHRPFRGDGLGETIASICMASPTRPSELAPHLSGAVDAFFERALAKDADQRAPSAREFAFEFSRLFDVSASSLDLSLSSLGSVDVPGGAMASQDRAGLVKAASSADGVAQSTLATVVSTSGGSQDRPPSGIDAPDEPQRTAGLDGARSNRGKLVAMLAASALLVALALVLVLVPWQGDGDPSQATAGGTTKSEGPMPTADPRAMAGGAPAEQAAREDAGTPATASSTGSPAASEAPKRRAVTSRSPRAKETAETSKPSPTTPAHKPPAGDGLDQFDNRF